MTAPILSSRRRDRRPATGGLLARAVAWGIVRMLIGVLAAGILVLYAVN